jgi:hypothetical protein
VNRATQIGSAIAQALVLLAEHVPMRAILIRFDGASYTAADRDEVVEMALTALLPLEQFSRSALASDPDVVGAARIVLDASEQFQALVISKCLEAGSRR